MKFYLLTALFIISFISTSSAQEKKRPYIPYMPYFVVKSDTLDPSIPLGSCLITGVVKYADEPLQDVRITSKNPYEDEIVFSQKNGVFSIKIDNSDYHIHFKHAKGTSNIENYFFNNQHHIVVEVYILENIIDKPVQMKKPVIYCYSDAPLSFQLSTNPVSGHNVFRYPETKANDTRWHMKINEEGNIENETGRTYPYLFWEAETYELDYTIERNCIEGSFVKGTNVIPFLEDALSELGLNDFEKTDFITFWAPQMIESDYVFIQFLVDQQYERIASINVNPKPDYMRRVYMLFSKHKIIPERITVKPQNLEMLHNSRAGFSIVEWGGSELDRSKIFENVEKINLTVMDEQ